MDELEASGAFDDNLSLTPGQDDIDRQLTELTSQSGVDDDLARLKAELGQGSPAQGELGAGAEGSGTGTEQPAPSQQERPA
jgi:phage shock protein A